MRPGFSADGYIIDQNHLGQYRYRGMSSDINGCGWVAAYDLLHAQGFEVDFETVHRQMNALFPRQIPGPTPVRKLMDYLARYGDYKLTAGKKAALTAALAAPAGILRYWEENVPHFVPFVRAGEGRYRFFNVNDGLEDFTCSMESFFAGHCTRPLVRVITPAEETRAG